MAGYTDLTDVNVPRLRSHRLYKQRPKDGAARIDNLPINTDADRDAETGHWQRVVNIDISDLDSGQTDSDPNRHNEFAVAQREDSSLSSYWQRASHGSNEFVIQNGILFWCNHNSTGTHEFQLILPEFCCHSVIALGHDHQLSVIVVHAAC